MRANINTHTSQHTSAEKQSKQSPAPEKQDKQQQPAQPENTAVVIPSADTPVPENELASHWEAHFMQATEDYCTQQRHSIRPTGLHQRRLTLTLPDKLHRDIKIYCVETDQRLGSLVSAILQVCFHGHPEVALPPLVQQGAEHQHQHQSALRA